MIHNIPQTEIIMTNHYKQAQLKNQSKLAAHAVFKMFCFSLCHLSTGEIKYFLAAAHNVSIVNVCYYRKCILFSY